MRDVTVGMHRAVAVGALILGIASGTRAGAQAVARSAATTTVITYRLPPAQGCGKQYGENEIVVCGSRTRDYRIDRSLRVEAETEVRHQDGRRAWEDEPRCSPIGGRVCPGTGEIPLAAIAAKIVETVARVVRGN